jgi:hypothetical protein
MLLTTKLVFWLFLGLQIVVSSHDSSEEDSSEEDSSEKECDEDFEHLFGTCPDDWDNGPFMCFK